MDANPDRVDRIRRTRSEVENHVIDELFAGRITRRDFVRRMTVLGMSASLAGFLAACSSDNGGGGTSPSATGASGATGAVVPGGTLKTGIIAPAGGAGPARRQRRGWPRRPRAVGRVPRVVQRPARIGAAHRGELDAERRRLGVDVRDPAGGHVPGRHAAHRRRRRRDHGAPCGPEEQVERALRIHRGALARRREGDRRRDGRVHAGCGERQLPVPGQLRQLQRDHPAQDVFRGLGQDVHRNGSLEDADLHARCRCHVRQEPRLLGPDAASRTPTRTRSRSTRRTRRRSWASRAAR